MSCKYCDKLVNPTKVLTANLNELERKTPDENEYVLPYYKL